MSSSQRYLRTQGGRLLDLHWMYLHRSLTLTHLLACGLAMGFFVFSLSVQKKSPRHQQFAQAFLVFGILAVIIATMMSGIGVFFREFSQFNNNPSANFLRSLRLDYATQFGYAIATLRGLVFCFIALEIFELQGVLQGSRVKYAKTLVGVLIAACLAFCLSSPHSVFFYYYLSLLGLFVSWGVVEVLARSQVTNKNIAHSMLAIFNFLIFVDTGILGGVRQYVVGAQSNTPLLFLAARLSPALLIFLYWIVRNKKSFESRSPSAK